MSLLGPGESPSIISFIHHHVSLGPQRVSFLHLIDPPPRLYWSPAGLLPSPYCSTTKSLLFPSESPSFTSLIHRHVYIGPQRVSFLHLIAPPPCLSWAPVGLLPSHHCSTTMSLLVPNGSPSFTTLLHHNVSLGPQWVSFLHLIAPPPSLSCSPASLLPSHHCSTTTSLLVPNSFHLIAPPPCLSWSPTGLLLSPHCSTTKSLLFPSESPSFTSLIHRHVYIGPQRVSFIHLITPPPCLSWSLAGLLLSPHCPTTVSLLVPNGSPSFTSLLHHHVSLGP